MPKFDPANLDPKKILTWTLFGALVLFSILMSQCAQAFEVGAVVFPMS